MSPYLKALLWPEWLRTLIHYRLLPFLGLNSQTMVLGILRGTFDTLLLLLLSLGFLNGGRLVMEGQYTLPRHIQTVTLKWAPIADQIARKVDIPREAPLVLWFKESSMQAVNPDNCTGIIGAYDLVRSGERPCYTPGPISDFAVREQLGVAAVEFKKRCPEVTYMTQDPELIKKCYFAYNAGSGAASRLDANESAYVMNGFDNQHQSMVYSDVELGTVQVTALGAWPTHLAFQSLIVSQIDEEEKWPLSFSLFALSTRIYDAGGNLLAQWLDSDSYSNASIEFPANRNITQQMCIERAYLFGRPSLRPKLNPVTESPLLTQDIHGCSYSLPGVDISSQNRSAVLQSPISGEVTTYTDKWANSTIRIENEEWIVWLLHSRSYFVTDGETVKRGEAVGVMGAVGYATGPHVHYTIYDKTAAVFVDPREFLP